MKLKKISGYVAIAALSAAAPFGAALAQSQGALYAFHTSPQGGCPGLDWHITVQGDNLEGFVAWDHGKHVARLDGKIIPVSAGKERSFKLDAVEVGSGKKATVQGNAGGEVINASIEGSGTACDGKILPIPRVTGGMGGGGG
jgi:hypothetical protein